MKSKNQDFDFNAQFLWNMFLFINYAIFSLWTQPYKECVTFTVEGYLNSLMRIYSLRGNEEGFREILKKKLKPVAQKVATKLWKRDGYRSDSYYDNIFIV